ncbi:hypothetical protein [Paraburkholderia tropica]|uniref:hypothetical protein n=1 Tax=Paraburkholderia tropica TaxID=92647 RepID=UPI002AB738AB|nr:hypothetical protein [Paraburkholderia tropica]
MATKQQHDRAPTVAKVRSKAATGQTRQRKTAVSRAYGLIEFAITSVDAKRLLPQRQARRGRFNLNAHVTVNPYKANDDGLVPGLKMALSLQLDGSSLSRDEEGNDVVGEKSFTIGMEAEARFKVSGELRADEEPSEQEIANLTQSVYPLAARQIQQYAADMGYRNVSPDLSILDEFEFARSDD